MSTYRERRAARAERLRGWAEKRAAKADSAYDGAQRAVEGIPFGQPILVGHHSEGRHRAALDRHDGRMRAAIEHTQKAERMNRRADEIERQADRAIYSDDPDAIEALEAKIAGLEATRARVKAINAAIRKGPGWEARIVPALTEAETKALLDVARYQPYYEPHKKGFPSYHLQNIGGNITRARQRLAQLKAAAVDCGTSGCAHDTAESAAACETRAWHPETGTTAPSGWDAQSGVRERLAALAELGPTMEPRAWGYHASRDVWYACGGQERRTFGVRQEGSASLAIIHERHGLERRAALIFIGYPER